MGLLEERCTRSAEYRRIVPCCSGPLAGRSVRCFAVNGVDSLPHPSFSAMAKIQECPACALEFEQDGTIEDCPYCGYELQPPAKGRTLLVLLLIVVFVGPILYGAWKALLG